MKRWNYLLKKIYPLPEEHYEGRIFFNSDTCRLVFDDGYDFLTVMLEGDNPCLHSDAFHSPSLMKDINLTILGDYRKWLNQPIELTEFFEGQHRIKHHIKGTAFRLIVNVVTAGFTEAILGTQYSTDESTWNYLDDDNNPKVSINSTGLKVSSWGLLSETAKGDVFLRIVGQGGDGIQDPAFGLITLQFR